MERTATVLVVDDNPTTRKLVRYALERQDHRVVEAADGAAALAQAEAYPPDLVLQDLVLPDIDGFALLARLRSRLPPGTPVLAFSGFVSKLEEARASAIGFDDLLVKPLEPSRLIQIVQGHLPGGASERFGAGRTLVVADDDPVQRKLAVFRLERLGFRVRGASDGAEALALARDNRPDAIVSDVMMPNLDGFRLCMEVRGDATLSTVPVVLVTSSYVDEEDQRLARQAGATAAILRTPDLGELVGALRAIFSGPSRAGTSPSRSMEQLEREHAQRVQRQLDRQVQLNADLAQQCTVLSAQLSILAGISTALARQVELDQALDEALAACFDAGEFSVGALCVLASRRVRWFGLAQSEGADRALLYDVARLGPEDLLSPLDVLPDEDIRTERIRGILQPLKLGSALLVPLVHEDEPVGALLLASKTQALLQEEHRSFAQGVGNQMSLALGLARTFEDKLLSQRTASETAATLEAVLDSLEDGVEVVDESGRSSFCNRAARPFAGKTEGVFQADWVTPIPPSELPVARAMRDEDPEPVELYTRKGGVADRCFLATARPLVGADGQKRGAVAVYRDVTTERRAQEQLMVSDRMGSVGQLAAGVVHELNDPLVALLADLDRALDDAGQLSSSAPEVATRLRDELCRARDAGERVREIVHDLELFSLASQESTGPIDVCAVLESSLRLARTEIRNRARLVLSLEPVAAVEGNPSHLGQVFLHLLLNAARAIEGPASQGKICVSSRMIEDRVVVRVEDSGRGLSPKEMSRLFTAFYSTKTPGVGASLGLFICAQIVRSMKGEIGVESSPGAGTAFWISLPSLPPGEPQQPSQ